MSGFLKTTTILVIVLTIAACGNTRLDRAASGAGIGAAGGTAIGLIAGGPILGAAAVGAVAGGAVGAITSKHQVDLGKAWWER